MRIVVVAILAVLLAAPAYADDTPTTVLHLIDAGKDAKTTLRLVAKKGAKKRMTLTMTMALTNNAKGAPTKIAIPPIEMSMDMKISDIAANGDLTCELTFGKMVLKSDASTPKAMIETFNKLGSAIAGTKGRMRFSSRGYTLETVIDIPETLPKGAADLLLNMRSSLSQVSAPLPEEPVGVGAKWETTQVIQDTNGIDLDQTTTSEIIAIKGKRTTLKQTVKQSAKPKKIKIKGMDMDLKSLSGGGSGEMSYDASTFVPVDGMMDVSTTVTLTTGGTTVETMVEMKLAMKVR